MSYIEVSAWGKIFAEMNSFPLTWWCRSSLPKSECYFKFSEKKNVQESNFELDNALHLHFPITIIIRMKCKGRKLRDFLKVSLRVAEAACLLLDPGRLSSSQYILHFDFAGSLGWYFESHSETSSWFSILCSFQQATFILPLKLWYK